LQWNKTESLSHYQGEESGPPPVSARIAENASFTGTPTPYGMADMSFGRAGQAAATQNDNYSMTTTSMMDNSATELYTTEERMAITGLERLRGREVDTSMQTSDTDSAMTGEPEDDLSISQMAAKEASSCRDNPAGLDEEAFNVDSSNESLPDSKPRASSRPQKKASLTPRSQGTGRAGGCIFC
jgi:hypothetical protein